jgi:hypothetical protein
MGHEEGGATREDKAMFTLQNTKSYAQEELDELNDLLAEVLAELTDEERHDKIIVDRVSERKFWLITTCAQLSEAVFFRRGMTPPPRSDLRPIF